MLSIQSRLKGTITGPDAFGAKTSGVIEADFFGNENASFSDVNGFRLRHAIVKLNWKTTEILAGQYWNPFFNPDLFPGTISFNTGCPFQPFSRNPQIRLTQTFGPISIAIAALSQRDFQSTGPDGYNVKYLRNSGIPNLHLQVQIKPKDTEHIFGFSADYKVLRPRLNSDVVYTWDTTINNVLYPASTTVKYKVDETVTAYSANAFMRIKTKPITFKLYGTYAQNAADHTMIGGYAVTGTEDKSIMQYNYSPYTTATAWTDIHTNGKTFQIGVFGGYLKNLGTSDSITGSIYSRGTNIESMFRVSPRVVFIREKLQVAFECEYTNALYGKQNGNGKGVPTNLKTVENTRFLFSMIYNF